MEKQQQPFLLHFFFFFFFFFFHFVAATLLPCLGQLLDGVSVDGGDDGRHQLQAYVVHVEKPAHMVFAGAEEREDWYKSFLPTNTLDSGEPRLIYSYEKVISGFAARLTPAEVEEMERRDGFLHAQPVAPVELRTTHSQQFMGLDRPGGMWDLTNKGEGMVIGVFDSGIDPTRPSFDDTGMPPRPAAWARRPCRFRNSTYRCNNKVVGAIAFDYKSPSPVADETEVHGTMVASCAAGSPVAGASYEGKAAGTASGAAPRAHIAVYKATRSADLLMAYDQAIMDGVDIFSVSKGYPSSKPYYNDEFVIGALSAVESGIFVSVAAGNTGPRHGTILDTAPWILSVGASSIDRAIEASIRLGDGFEVLGESLLPPGSAFPSAPLPLVYPGAGGAPEAVKNCTTLSGVDVRRKIVLCMASEAALSNLPRVCSAAAAGAAAVVLMNQRTDGSSVGNTLCLDFDAARNCSVPMVQVSHLDSHQLQRYAAAASSSSSNPTATIRFTGTRLGVRPSPVVASFSSRGPSSVNNGILKPDILGPGLNTLASLPWSAPFPFVMLFGTSFSCPHLSGIAAMLKKSHPTWSPAAIKSAIMTTADMLDNTGSPITDETGGRADLFATGAGHVNPTKANDPGLVYDLDRNDYTRYVCGLGYTSQQVKTILRRPVDCSVVGSISGEELNYPSFSVSLGPMFSKSVRRRVTNVQPSTASYTVSVDSIPGVRVDVLPRQLDFQMEGQTRDFTVTFVPTTPRGVPGTTVDGHLRWSSTTDHHVVRSPIAVSFA